MHAAGVAKVARNHKRQREGSAEAEEHGEKLHIRAQASVVGAEAARHSKLQASGSRGVAQQLYVRRQVQVLGECFAGGWLRIQNQFDLLHTFRLQFRHVIAQPLPIPAIVNI